MKKIKLSEQRAEVAKSLRDLAELWKRPPENEIAQRARPGEVGKNQSELQPHNSISGAQFQAGGKL